MDKNISLIKDKNLDNNDELGDTANETTVRINETLNEGNLNQYKEKRLLVRDKDSTEEFKKDIKDTRLSAENILNDLIAAIKEKKGEWEGKISDYKTECQTPLTDVLENDSTIIIRVDLPGVEREDISVHLIEKAIEIMAVFPGKGNPGHYIKRERNYGRIVRRIGLSKKVNEKAIKSTFKDCILTIELPKLVKDRYKVKIN
jgi:HSP20 family protein